MHRGRGRGRGEGEGRRGRGGGGGRGEGEEGEREEGEEEGGGEQEGRGAGERKKRRTGQHTLKAGVKHVPFRHPTSRPKWFDLLIQKCLYDVRNTRHCVECDTPPQAT